MLKQINWAVFLLLAAVVMVVGCDSTKAKKPDGTAEESHEHGPNDGELIVLGEGFVEFVHDDEKEIVTLYMLEKDKKTSKPIEVDEAVIEITLAGAPTKFSLSPKPMESESADKSSRFESTDKQLSMALENREAQRKLHVMTSDGKAMAAEIEHYDHHHHGHDEDADHGKDGHDKDGHDDKDDDHDKTAPAPETPKS
jgi:hypothetical protein